MRQSGVLLLCGALLAGGCSGDEAEPANVLATDPEPAVRVLGVPPASFQCDSVAPLADIARITGVTEADIESQPSPFSPPTGVAEPCYFAIATPAPASEQSDAAAPAPRTLSFDIDCRPRALTDAADLMATYATGAEASAVRIGKSGLDHSGVQVLFIDDNAPCYVRVTAPERKTRLALARLIAENLTAQNAPMSTRYAAAP